jgi:hypothetical protein
MGHYPTFITKDRLPWIPHLPVSSQIIRKAPRCPLCGQDFHPHHVAAGCPVALRQGRYTWRHNQVLQHLDIRICNQLRKSPTAWQVQIDLDNNASMRNLPVSIFGVQSLRPDIVLIHPLNKTVIIGELTVPLPHRMQYWSHEKRRKYAPCIHAAMRHGWNSKLFTMEVSCYGHLESGIQPFLFHLGSTQEEALRASFNCCSISQDCTQHLYRNSSSFQAKYT